MSAIVEYNIQQNKFLTHENFTYFTNNSIFDGMLYGCDQTNECGLSILDGMLYAIWV